MNTLRLAQIYRYWHRLSPLRFGPVRYGTFCIAFQALTCELVDFNCPYKERFPAISITWDVASLTVLSWTFGEWSSLPRFYCLVQSLLDLRPQGWIMYFCKTAYLSEPPASSQLLFLTNNTLSALDISFLSEFPCFMQTGRHFCYKVWLIWQNRLSMNFLSSPILYGFSICIYCKQNETNLLHPK